MYIYLYIYEKCFTSVKGAETKVRISRPFAAELLLEEDRSKSRSKKHWSTMKTELYY